MDKTPLVTYFDVRGRAEPIRLMLEDAGVPYREKRVQVHEWPALKPTLLFGQLPLYEEGELQILQSHAIYRYLARKHALYGSNEAERIRCDIVAESAADAWRMVSAFYWDPAFAQKREEFERATLPQIMAPMQKLQEQYDGGRGWWVCDGLTYADFLAWHFLDYVRPFSLQAIARSSQPFTGLRWLRRRCCIWAIRWYCRRAIGSRISRSSIRSRADRALCCRSSRR